WLLHTRRAGHRGLDEPRILNPPLILSPQPRLPPRSDSPLWATKDGARSGGEGVRRALPVSVSAGQGRKASHVRVRPGFTREDPVRIGQRGAKVSRLPAPASDRREPPWPSPGCLRTTSRRTWASPRTRSTTGSRARRCPLTG